MSRNSAGSRARFALAPSGEPGGNRLRLSEPVVVLTSARSGSTLLRFILDSHPELACPPETGVLELCTRMGVMSMLLDGPPVGVRPGLTELAAASIRSWLTATFGPYLIRAGKARFCDKSLGSAESAHRFLDLFPQAKFICLYRNCLDVIDSTLEACPFGLRGYGIEPFAAAHSGNSVAAVADYWLTHTQMITKFERGNPGVCLRLRYEDLVADPEKEASRIFAFLGEAPVPGISETCLAADRDNFGPGDHKIWATSSITPDSVGRGSRIPLEAITPPMITMMSGLLEEIGYPPMGLGQPGQARPEAPAVRAGAEAVPAAGPGRDGGAAAPAARGGDVTVLDELEGLLASRITGNDSPGPQAAAAGETCFTITATMPSAGAGAPQARWWRIDPATASMMRLAADPVGGQEASGWSVAGDARTWRSVLIGELNLASALRRGHLRYFGVHGDDDVPYALRGDPQSGILGRLLAARATERQ